MAEQVAEVGSVTRDEQVGPGGQRSGKNRCVRRRQLDLARYGQVLVRERGRRIEVRMTFLRARDRLMRYLRRPCASRRAAASVLVSMRLSS